MAVSNGRLRTSELTRIPARHYTHAEPTYLRADAAASFFRVAALYEARYGKPMRAISFYRTYQRQVEIFLQRYTKRPSGITRKQHRTDRVWSGRVWKLRSGFAVSATPGLSNHGNGLAMDLTDGLNVRTSEKHRWWASIARDHGWTIRYDIGEPWHAEYNPAHDRHRGTAPKTVPAAVAVEGVTITQQRLAALGYAPGPVDGKLGARAKAAVKQFQQDYGITTDGVPGPSTRKALDTMATIAEDIKALSKKLDALPKLVWGIGGGPHAPMINRRFEKGSEYPETTLGSMTDRIIRHQIVPLRGEVAGLAKAVEQIGKGEPVDLDAVRAAARAGVTDALGDVTADVTVTVAKEE